MHDHKINLLIPMSLAIIKVHALLHCNVICSPYVLKHGHHSQLFLDSQTYLLDLSVNNNYAALLA